jgi:hypothetical protein
MWVFTNRVNTEIEVVSANCLISEFIAKVDFVRGGAEISIKSHVSIGKTDAARNLS